MKRRRMEGKERGRWEREIDRENQGEEERGKEQRERDKEMGRRRQRHRHRDRNETERNRHIGNRRERWRPGQGFLRPCKWGQSLWSGSLKAQQEGKQLLPESKSQTFFKELMMVQGMKF